MTIEKALEIMGQYLGGRREMFIHGTTGKDSDTIKINKRIYRAYNERIAGIKMLLELLEGSDELAAKFHDGIITGTELYRKSLDLVDLPGEEEQK